MHLLGGMPMQGQSLQEVEQLLLDQIEKLKQGDFDEWMLKAIVNQYKKEQIEAYESNKSRAQAMLSSFVYNQDWGTFINEINELEKITKEDIVKFVNKYYGDNYVVIYKRQGEVPCGGARRERRDLCPAVEYGSWGALEGAEDRADDRRGLYHRGAPWAEPRRVHRGGTLTPRGDSLPTL